jgi:hypothetical protein
VKELIGIARAVVNCKPLPTTAKVTEARVAEEREKYDYDIEQEGGFL